MGGSERRREISRRRIRRKKMGILKRRAAAANPSEKAVLAHKIRRLTPGATELIEHAPWFAEAWNQRALARFHRREYNDSIRDCRQALEINPYHFGAASGMGQCYLKLGDRLSALESFRRALRLNPNLERVRAQVIHLQKLLQDE